MTSLFRLFAGSWAEWVRHPRLFIRAHSQGRQAHSSDGTPKGGRSWWAHQEIGRFGEGFPERTPEGVWRTLWRAELCLNDHQLRRAPVCCLLLHQEPLAGGGGWPPGAHSHHLVAAPLQQGGGPTGPGGQGHSGGWPRLSEPPGTEHMRPLPRPGLWGGGRGLLSEAGPVKSRVSLAVFRPPPLPRAKTVRM